MKLYFATDVHGSEIFWKKSLMISNLVAAAIYFGFSYYRRRQGIEIEKVYKEIPVE